MAIFNQQYLHSYIVESYDEDPKYKSKQYRKALKVVQSIVSSEEFINRFNNIKVYFNTYDDKADDDASYVFGDFLRGKAKYICMVYFDSKDIESGEAQKAADYIINKFKKEKSDSKLEGVLKSTPEKYQNTTFCIDYKI